MSADSAETQAQSAGTTVPKSRPTYFETVGITVPVPISRVSYFETDTEAFENAKRSAGLGLSPAPVGALLLANTLLGGSGMLGIPHAFAESGMVLGVMLIVICGCFSAFGCHLLATSAVRIGVAPSSFYASAGTVLPGWTWLIDGAVMMKCFGVATSYLIICGDLITPAATAAGLRTNRQTWIFTVFCVIGGPLATVQNLSKLRFTSMAAVGIVIWTLLLIVLFYCDFFDPCADQPKEDPGGGPSEDLEGLARRLDQIVLPCSGAKVVNFGHDFLGFLKVLPVFIFGFTCHQNIFTVVNEVQQATQRRIDRMIGSAYIVAGTAFTMAAVMGYQSYGNKIHSNVLAGYPQHPIVEVTRMLFSAVVIFSYPLQIHPSRISCLALLNVAFPLGATGKEPDASRDLLEKRRFKVVTAVLLSGSLGIALTVKSLGTVLGVVGATGSTMVTFILPGMLYMAAFPSWHTQRYLALCQAITGCIVMPVCLTTVFLSGGASH